MPFVECYSKPLSDDAIITEEEAVRIREMTKHDNNLKESNPKPAPKRGSSFDAIYKATMGTNTATTPLAPGSTPWTNVVRTPTLSVSRQKEPHEKVTKIKGVARLEGVHPAILYESFILPECRTKWDKNLIDMYPSQSFGGNSDVLYQSFNYPFPLTNRDNLVNRYQSFNPELGQYTIVWRSCYHPDMPEQKSFIRTWTAGSYVIEPCPRDPHSSILYSFGQIDPFGWLPDWFITSFSPTALKDLIGKVTKMGLAEQKLRFGAAGRAPDGFISPVFNPPPDAEGGEEEELFYDATSGRRLSAERGRESMEEGGRESTGSLRELKPKSVRLGTVQKMKKKKKKLYSKILSYFKKAQSLEEKNAAKKTAELAKAAEGGVPTPVLKRLSSGAKGKKGTTGGRGGRTGGFSDW